MKTLRFIGVALLTVLMSVNFSACGGDDDDNGGGGSSASIEGVWYLKSETSYKWDSSKNQYDKTKPHHSETYADYEKQYTHTFTPITNGYRDTYTDGYDDWRGIEELVNLKDGAYELYEVSNSSGNRKLQGKAYIKSVTTNRMTIEYEYTQKSYDVVTYMR